MNELQYKRIYIIFKLHYVIRYKVKQVYSNHVFVVSEHLKDTDWIKAVYGLKRAFTEHLITLVSAHLHCITTFYFG